MKRWEPNRMVRSILLCLCSLLLTGKIQAQVPSFLPKENSGITEIADIGNFYGHGASAADFDNDGDIDFYLCTMNGFNDRLYRNTGDGTFEDVTTLLGINSKGSSRMGLWLDYNADGLLDLVLLIERCANFKCGQPILIDLYEQQENGSFLEKSEQAGLVFGDKYDNIEVYSVGGMAAGDLNGDQYLDLLVTIWGGQMTLFMNNGDGTFSDESITSGLGADASYYWQPMIYDFDHDGRPDIFNNVDFGPNQFWKNNGNGSFTEIASQIGMAVDNSEMGMALGDFDNDGDLDCYSTNITRIFQGSQEHNVLLRNDSEAGFIVFNERAEAYGVDMSGWDWGTTWIDINNDGWIDLATTNGWNNDPDWGPDQSHLWLNSNASFSDVSVQTGFNDMLSATSLISFDADRDGDLDLLQTLKDNESTKLPAVLYENKLENTGSANNYLVVRPEMNGPNRFAIGTVVRVKAGGRSMMRYISAGTSYFAQEPSEAFFGLGTADTAGEIRLEWPDGRVTIMENIPAGQVLDAPYVILESPELMNATIVPEGVHLEWLDNSDNEAGFVIQRSASDSFNEVSEIQVAPGETSYLDPVGEISSLYYRVKAVNGQVRSEYSRTIRASTVTAVQEQHDRFVLYPNPSSGEINIRMDHNHTGLLEVVLIDQSGRRVWSGEFKKDDYQSEARISPDLQPGSYFVRITLGVDTYVRRVLILP